MAKLILDIEPSVIKHAEDYANETHTDLSLLVEGFLKSIPNNTIDQNEKMPEKVKNIEIADWVKKLTISKVPTPDFDHKAEYGKHIEEKYGL